MLPIHVHFISFWNLLVPSPYCSFIAILSSLYHILIIVFSAPCSLAYMFFSSYTRAKSQSYRHIMVGFLPHSDTLHTFTTYYHSALFMNNNKTITIILPQKIWNNIHHDTIYIYNYVGIKTMFRKLPHRRDVPAGSTPRASSSAFSRTALKPGTEGKSQEKTWVTIDVRNPKFPDREMIYGIFSTSICWFTLIYTQWPAVKSSRWHPFLLAFSLNLGD